MQRWLRDPISGPFVVVAAVDVELPAPLEISRTMPTRFDADRAHAQLIALVSPTCPLCLEGVEIVIAAFQDRDRAPFNLHLAWLPILDGDDVLAASTVAREITAHSRITHYWDLDRQVSSAAYEALVFTSRRKRVAWDLYLLYQPGATWRRPLPSPDIWLHQADIPDQVSLTRESMSDALDQVPSAPLARGGLE
jgi:hypothetical protein